MNPDEAVGFVQFSGADALAPAGGMPGISEDRVLSTDSICEAARARIRICSSALSSSTGHCTEQSHNAGHHAALRSVHLLPGDEDSVLLQAT